MCLGEHDPAPAKQTDLEEERKSLNEKEFIQATEGIRRGLESMRRGGGRPAADVFAELEEKYPYLRRK